MCTTCRLKNGPLESNSVTVSSAARQLAIFSRTPLHIAANNGHLNVVRVLLSAPRTREREIASKLSQIKSFSSDFFVELGIHDSYVL